MAEQRQSKRSAKPPTRFDEGDHNRPAKKFVYRLLKKSDVKKTLVGEEVHVLWPDNGTWYRAEVEDLNAKKLTATLFYGDTEEQEIADLAELIQEGQIAFSTWSSLLFPHLTPCEGLNGDLLSTLYTWLSDEANDADRGTWNISSLIGSAVEGSVRIPVNCSTPLTSLENTVKFPSRLMKTRRAGTHGVWFGGLEFLAEEEHSIDHISSNDEIELDQLYRGRQKVGGSSQGLQRDEDDDNRAAGEDDGAEEKEDARATADSSDPSFSEEGGSEGQRGGSRRAGSRRAGSKRRNEGGGARGSESESDAAGDESEEDIELEEFEKKELLQDASDDDKPLVVRQAQEERKQRREAKRAQAQPAHTSPAPALSGGSLGSGGVRPRRRASAGVVAATQALAAAAGVSGGGAPPKSPAQQHPSAEEAGAVVDEEEAAERYAESLLTKVTAQKVVEKGSFYGSLGKRPSGIGSTQSEEELREKVRGRLVQALELAAKEGAAGDVAGAEGGEAARGDPSQVAAAVEGALLQLCGGVNKEYKSKCQSLWFNLKDPHNPDLRGRVLGGELAPDRLVQMSATELASRELAEYRRQKEEEALKMSVLDAEVAARFSTAAALDARDRLAKPAQLVASKLLSAREARRSRSPTPPPRGSGGGQEQGGGGRLSASEAGAAGWGGEGQAADVELERVQEEEEKPGEAEEGSAAYRVSDAGPGQQGPKRGANQGAGTSAGGGAGQQESYDPEKGLEDEDLKGDLSQPGNLIPPPPPPGSPPAPSTGDTKTSGPPGGINWASVKAAALQESTLAAPPPPPPLLDATPPPAGASQHSQDSKKRRLSDGHERPHSHSPRPGPSPQDPPPSPGSLSHLTLPPSDPGLLGGGVWEGRFVVPGAGAVQLRADALAGSGDVAGMLGEQEVELKGRVALAKLDHFLVDLHRSKTRTVTVGLLRLAEGTTREEGGLFKETVAHYKERQRTGFGEAREYKGAGGAAERIEAYVVPSGDLTRRVIQAVRQSGHSRGAMEACLPAGARDIQPDQLLLLLIHKRDWTEWFQPGNIQRPVRNARKLPPPKTSDSNPPPPPPPPPSAPLPQSQPQQTAPVAQPAAIARQLQDPRIAPSVHAVPAASSAPAPPAATAPAPASVALPDIDWEALKAITASLGTTTSQSGGGTAAPASSAALAPASSAPGRALPPIPDLSSLQGGLQGPPQQAQQGPGGQPPAAQGAPPPWVVDSQQQQLLRQGLGSGVPAAPAASLPFDPSQLQMLLAAQQGGQQAAQQEPPNRKRKSRWEAGEGGGGEGGRQVVDAAGEAGLVPPPRKPAPATSAFGPMRRQAPPGQTNPQGEARPPLGPGAPEAVPPQQQGGQQQQQPPFPAIPQGHFPPQAPGMEGALGAAPPQAGSQVPPPLVGQPGGGATPQYQPQQGQQPQLIFLPPDQAGGAGPPQFAPPLQAPPGFPPPGAQVLLPQQGPPGGAQHAHHGPPSSQHHPSHHHPHPGRGQPFPGRRGGGRGDRGGYRGRGRDRDRGRGPPGGRRGGGRR